MTAINPARLRIQCAELSKKASEPDRFVSGLHDLLTFYSARVRHTELTKTPLTLQSYQVPPPVLRILVKELEEPLEGDPRKGLDLVDRLWKEDWVEFRQLAISILGNLPPYDSDAIIKHVHDWLGSCTSEDIRQEIMFRGLDRLISEVPSSIISLLEKLVASRNKADHQAALFGLRSLAMNPDYEDFPTIFRLLGEILLMEETWLLKEINTLLRDLQEQVEEETAFFLVQQLSIAARPRINRVIRTAAGAFNKNNEQMLKDAIKNYS